MLKVILGTNPPQLARNAHNWGNVANLQFFEMACQKVLKIGETLKT